MVEFLPLSRPQIGLRRLVYYFVTLAVIFMVYLKFSELKLMKDLFLRSNFWWLVGIIVTQFFSYYSLALNYRYVLLIKDLSISAKKLFPATFVIQFLNQAVPSAGLSGQAFFIQYLKKYGLTLGEGISRAILELLTLYMAFGVFFLISAILMFKNNALAATPIFAYIIYLFILLGVIFSGIFFAFQRKRRGALARWLTDHLSRYFQKKGRKNISYAALVFDQFRLSLRLEELRKNGRILWAAVFWQGMVLFFNIVSLKFISYAVDFPLSFSVAFVVFTLTRFLSMVSFVPGALGIFEGGMTLILTTFQVPLDLAFAMTMLLRAFTFWLPMPLGWLLYRYFIHRQELETPYEKI